MKLIVFTCIATQIITLNANVTHFVLPEPCDRFDPNLRSCALERMQVALPYWLKNGVPEYDFPTMDPLNIPFMPFDLNINDFITVNGTLKNLKVTDLSKFVINDLHADGQNYILEVELFHPHLGLDVELDVSGKAFDVLIPFDGYLKGNITNIRTRVKLSTKIVERERVKYFTVNKLKMKRTIGACLVDIVSKDPDNQVFADFAKNLFNRNFKQASNRVDTYLGELLENFVTEQIEKVLSSVPGRKFLL